MDTKELLEKATARPWHCKGFPTIASKGNGNIAKVLEQYMQKNIREANAELITRAVNNFEGMLEALKAVLEMGDEYEAEKLVREAIKQAERG